MNFNEFIQAIVESDSEDWVRVDRPVFLQSLDWGRYGSSRHDEIVGLEEHSQIATFRADLAISIARGFSHRESFREPWTDSFPDKSASSSLVDLLWNGRPVYRATEVIVDGGRASLPIPRIGTLEVPRRKYQLFRLLDELFGTGDLDRYFSMAGMVLVEEPWPE